MKKISMHKKTLSIAVAAGSLLLVPDYSLAQGAVLEEVLVTATRRSESILDIPYNISAVSGASLEAAQITDQAELLRSVAGVGVIDRGHRNSGTVNTIRIRGLNVDSSIVGDFATASAPTVSTYVNDTPVFANFVLKDLERVEVLRGPQGTLYGSGSLAGTVRYIMRKPEFEEVTGKVAASLSHTEGSSGLNWTTDATLNIPFSDTVALRVLAGRNDEAGITDYPNVYVLDSTGVPVAPNGVLADDAVYKRVNDADDVDIRFARAALRFQPNDRIDATLSHHWQSDDVGARRGTTDGTNGNGVPYNDYELGAVQLEPSSRDINLTSLEADIDLGFATLTSSTSHYDHSGEGASENTGFYAQLGWLAAFYYNYPRPMARAERTYDDEAFIQELRLVSSTDGPVDYLVGLYYQDQTVESGQDSFLLGFKNWADAAFGPGVVIDDQDFLYRRTEDFRDASAYGELTWHITDSVHLTGGVRYFDNKSDIDTFQQISFYDGFRPSAAAAFSQSDSDALFKVNLAWDMNDDTLVYGTVSEGYRRGGANAVPTVGLFAEDPAWQLYDADTVVNYELGVKGSRGQHTYTAALFYVDWDKVQLNSATTNWAFFAVQNGDEAASQGLELELRGPLATGLDYSLGYAYVDAELTGDLVSADPAVTTPVATDGTRLPGAPEHSFNMSLDYSRQLSSGMDWFTRLDAYYQSSSENSISSSPRFARTLDGFQLWNIVSSIRTAHWDLSLFAKNIFNEEGVTGVYKEEYMGSDASQNYLGNGAKDVISRPRTVGLAATYRF
ncbi:TonB-dependent receptor [Kineobactrum sediminis]|uniref:TonB-dependent receptor n=1 Tax=Kineobactrum sediminis TaxID=1905677 RepID=A0A2N5Y657_9GAMM|nr:TonB-dependent receptor [Kineobactrum sediminis]PLW83877.1 TonB-dependent receptor [Kineobactrum sediminis]